MTEVIKTTLNSDGTHRLLGAQEKNSIVFNMIDLLRAQWRETGEVSDTVLKNALYQEDVIDMLYPTARDFLNREIERNARAQAQPQSAA